MNVTCDKCGAPLSADQAFCSKCGAVRGATQGRREEPGFDMAATMVGQKFPAMPPPPPKAPVPQPVQKPAPPRPTPQPTAPPVNATPVNRMVSPQPQPPVATGSSNRALYLILGLFAVLVLGGLLAFFVYVIFSGS